MKVKQRIKALIKKGLRKREIRRIKQTAPRISKNRIVEDLKKIGINAGDTVLLHSSLKRVGYVDGGASAVIKAFQEAVSADGTLVIPTYQMLGSMYNTCLEADYIFDPRTAGTSIGAIPDAFLKCPDVYRSIHPTHSVSATGKHAKFITEAHHLAASTFGADSPWDRLLKVDGKIFMLGLYMGRNTFSHVLEDRMLDRFPLPVRMQKTYYLNCRDWDGKLLQVPVNPLDPEFAVSRMDQKDRQDLRDYFWEELNNAGILYTGNIGQARSWFAMAKQYYDCLLKLMNEGLTIYSTAEEIARHRKTRKQTENNAKL